jgi:exopolysaccharide biosynthesis polyprenyl glycosylphosphotransferase
MSRKFELISLLLGDLSIILAVFFISWKASAINYSAVSGHAIYVGIVLAFYWIFIFQTFKLYETRPKIQLMNEMVGLFRALLIGIIGLIALAYITNIQFIRARGFLPSYVTTISALFLWRLLWRGFTGENINRRLKKVMIFKNGEPAAQYPGFSVVKEMKINEINPNTSREIFRTNKIDGIIVESNGHVSDDILTIISDFALTDYEIYVSPKLYPLVYHHFLIQKVPDSSLLKIIFHPLSNWDRFLKRLTDVAISGLAIFFLSPLLLMIALFIKIDSRGPIFYRQKRVGFHGRKVDIFKFRSMVTDAEKHTGPVWALKNDQRITRMGRIMRPLRVDEWPQLINVLKGEMSFVGPRPERPHFVTRFRKEIPLYGLRLTVNPGITGLAQVRHSYDRDLNDVRKKLEYDLDYINNISLQTDMKIFLKTILTVLKKEGAH